MIQPNNFKHCTVSIFSRPNFIWLSKKVCNWWFKKCITAQKIKQYIIYTIGNVDVVYAKFKYIFQLSISLDLLVIIVAFGVCAQ